MPTLDNPHNVKASAAVEIRSANQTVIIWDLELKSSSDSLIVPSLYVTYNPLDNAQIKTGLAAPMTLGITAVGATNADGASVVTITGGVAGQRIMLATIHQKGLRNNLSVDESS